MTPIGAGIEVILKGIAAFLVASVLVLSPQDGATVTFADSPTVPCYDPQR